MDVTQFEMLFVFEKTEGPSGDLVDISVRLTSTSGLDDL